MLTAALLSVLRYCSVLRHANLQVRTLQPDLASAAFVKSFHEFSLIVHLSFGLIAILSLDFRSPSLICERLLDCSP